MRGLGVMGDYFFSITLASMESVACGTARSLSLGMSLPVTRQMPYVLFSIRMSAALRFWIYFICLEASRPISSLLSTDAPSSRTLKTGDVSFTSLPSPATIAARCSYSACALTSFSLINWRNSSNSWSV